MEETVSQISDNTFKKYFPTVTVICCLASIILFVGINFEGDLDNWAVYKKWGGPSMTDIFSGDYWGLITSNFLHVEIWHIAFNLYWLWKFGKKIEFETNKLFYALLIFSSGLVSSLAQLAFSETTGIGLSGIGYALFGYLYVQSKTTIEYKNYLEKSTIKLFIFWLVLCVVLTMTGAWAVGNAAHIGGLLWGVMLAFLCRYTRYVQWVAGFSFVILLVILIFYNPFSTSYLSFQAYDLHKKQRVNEAIEVYKKILKRDPENQFAKVNLKQLDLQQLQEKALDLHKKQKYGEARKLYNQILSLDKDNQWAKENLYILPVE
jgi:membrane associated rhomboid family serine protease